MESLLPNPDSAVRAFTDVDNERDLLDAVNRTMDEYSQSRPANTMKMYMRKQEEFRHWCTKVRQFDTGVLVSEKNLMLFVREWVLLMGNKRKHQSEGRLSH